eukprot:IDg13293t1
MHGFLHRLAPSSTAIYTSDSTEIENGDILTMSTVPVDLPGTTVGSGAGATGSGGEGVSETYYIAPPFEKSSQDECDLDFRGGNYIDDAAINLESTLLVCLIAGSKRLHLDSPSGYRKNHTSEPWIPLDILFATFELSFSW